MNQISALREHKYFHPYYVYCKVYLNEVEQTVVITADADEGWLVRYKTNETGSIVCDESTCEPVTETLTGAVRIEYRPPVKDNDGNL